MERLGVYITVLAFVAGLSFPASGDVDVTRGDPSSVDEHEWYDEFIVTYKKESEERQRGGARDIHLNEMSRELGVEITVVRRLYTGGDLIKTGAPLDRNGILGLMEAFQRNESVEYIEPNLRLQPQYHEWPSNGTEVVPKIRTIR